MKRVDDWQQFSKQVESHIENYAIKQYGDRGDDLASTYSPHDCIAAIKKYAARHGKNARPDQDLIDLLKIAHYAQMAHLIMSDENGND